MKLRHIFRFHCCCMVCCLHAVKIVPFLLIGLFCNIGLCGRYLGELVFSCPPSWCKWVVFRFLGQVHAVPLLLPRLMFGLSSCSTSRNFSAVSWLDCLLLDKISCSYSFVRGFCLLGLTICLKNKIHAVAFLCPAFVFGIFSGSNSCWFEMDRNIACGQEFGSGDLGIRKISYFAISSLLNRHTWEQGEKDDCFIMIISIDHHPIPDKLKSGVKYFGNDFTIYNPI